MLFRVTSNTNAGCFDSLNLQRDSPGYHAKHQPQDTTMPDPENLTEYPVGTDQLAVLSRNASDLDKLINGSGTVTNRAGTELFSLSQLFSGEITAFTPTIEGGTNQGTGTYPVQTGATYQLGRMMDVSITVTVDSHDGTGPILIKGLAQNAQNYSILNCHISDASAPDNVADYHAVISAGESDIRLIAMIDYGAESPATLPVGGAFTVKISGRYLVELP